MLLHRMVNYAVLAFSNILPALASMLLLANADRNLFLSPAGMMTLEQERDHPRGATGGEAAFPAHPSLQASLQPASTHPRLPHLHLSPKVMKPSSHFARRSRTPVRQLQVDSDTVLPYPPPLESSALLGTRQGQRSSKSPRASPIQGHRSPLGKRSTHGHGYKLGSGGMKGPSEGGSRRGSETGVAQKQKKLACEVVVPPLPPPPDPRAQSRIPAQPSSVESAESVNLMDLSIDTEESVVSFDLESPPTGEQTMDVEYNVVPSHPRATVTPLASPVWAANTLTSTYHPASPPGAMNPSRIPTISGSSPRKASPTVLSPVVVSMSIVGGMKPEDTLPLLDMPCDVPMNTGDTVPLLGSSLDEDSIQEPRPKDFRNIVTLGPLHLAKQSMVQEPSGICSFVSSSVSENASITKSVLPPGGKTLPLLGLSPASLGSPGAGPQEGAPDRPEVTSPAPLSTPDLRVDMFEADYPGEGWLAGNSDDNMEVRSPPVLPTGFPAITPEDLTPAELHEFDMKYGSPHHARSRSIKSLARPTLLALPLERPRLTSLPVNGADDDDDDYYRLRHFSITGRRIVNRGDSFKSRRTRSNTSVASDASRVVTSLEGGANFMTSLEGACRSLAPGLPPAITLSCDDVSCMYPSLSPVHTVSSDVHTISSDVHTISSDVHTISSDVHTISSDVHTVSSDVHTISSDVHTISSDVHTISSDVHTISSDVHTISSDVHTISSDVHTISSDVHTISSDVHTISSDVHTISSDVHTISPDVHTISSDVHTISSDVHTISSDVHTISSDVHTISSDVHTISSDVHTISSDVHTISSDVHTISSDVHTISSDVHTISSDSDVHTISSDVHTISSDVHTISSDVHTISSDVHTISSDVHTISSDVHTISSDVHTISSDVHTISSDVHTISSDVHTISSDVHTISSDVHTISSDVHTISSDVHTISSEVHTISSDVHTISSDVHNISSDVHTISSDVHNISSDVHTISSNVHTISSNVHTISSDVHTISSDVHNISSDVHTISSNVHTISSDVHTISSDVHNILVYVSVLAYFSSPSGPYLIQEWPDAGSVMGHVSHTGMASLWNYNGPEFLTEKRELDTGKREMLTGKPTFDWGVAILMYVDGNVARGVAILMYVDGNVARGVAILVYVDGNVARGVAIIMYVDGNVARGVAILMYVDGNVARGVAILMYVDGNVARGVAILVYVDGNVARGVAILMYVDGNVARGMAILMYVDGNVARGMAILMYVDGNVARGVAILVYVDGNVARGMAILMYVDGNVARGMAILMYVDGNVARGVAILVYVDGNVARGVAILMYVDGNVARDEEFGEHSVSILLDGEESEIMFVDHPADEMTVENYLGTYEPHAFVVVYSVVEKTSFQRAEEVLQYLWRLDVMANKGVILVGNKTDIVRSRCVTSKEGSNLADSYDCKYIETSSGFNHQVDELLVGILKQIRLKSRDSEVTARKRSTRKKKYRGSKTSASLKVKSFLTKVCGKETKSKSCENLHVL
nr:uncharacterized protein LOC128702922 [Cherax quadricarinatus]